MDTEQTVVTTQETTTENQVQDVGTVENKVETKEPEFTPITFNSQEELDKFIKSENSKYMNVKRKELGLKDGESMKSLKEKYDLGLVEFETTKTNLANKNKDFEELTAKYNELESANKKFSLDKELSSIGVKGDKIQDFLVLADSKKTEGQSYTDVAKQLMEDYPNLFIGKEVPDIGIDKSESANKKNETPDWLARFLK